MAIGSANPSLVIDPSSGTIRIGDAIRLESHETRASVESKVADLANGARDHGNGYAWLYLGGLTFGSQPAGMGLCFHDDRLEQIDWNVRLPDAPMEGGWPTREAIDDELSFVRSVMVNEMGLTIGQTTWGEVWSAFDAKGFLASNGLRYRLE